MIDITAPSQLWASSMLPEGILEHWVARHGAMVEKNEPVATVRIEGALHFILSPARGELQIAHAANELVEPDSVIGGIIVPDMEAKALEAAFDQSLMQPSA